MEKFRITGSVRLPSRGGALLFSTMVVPHDLLDEALQMVVFGPGKQVRFLLSRMSTNENENIMETSA